MTLPASWRELLDRLARQVGDVRDAEEWLRDAVEARWGVTSLHDLDRVSRAVAFQKASGVLLALEEQGLPDELVAPDGDLPPILLYRDGSIEPADGYPGRRRVVAGTVARYFDGVAVEGPPWRIADGENERPTYDEYVAAADFGALAG
jgi:hypothetical protein